MATTTGTWSTDQRRFQSPGAWIPVIRQMVGGEKTPRTRARAPFPVNFFSFSRFRLPGNCLARGRGDISRKSIRCTVTNGWKDQTPLKRKRWIYVPVNREDEHPRELLQLGKFTAIGSPRTRFAGLDPGTWSRSGTFVMVESVGLRCGGRALWLMWIMICEDGVCRILIVWDSLDSLGIVRDG